MPTYVNGIQKPEPDIVTVNGLPVADYTFTQGQLLVTGQTTQRDSELDDGYYEKGLTKQYEILTTGQYAGTSNVTLLHLVSSAGDIGFANNSPLADTITSIVFDFTTMFVAGDVIVISGATDAGNNSVRTIAAGGVAANIITLTEANVLTTRVLDANAISFSKREAISNNVVHDIRTNLFWTRYQPTKFGTLSLGRMPWTGTVYDIFQCAARVNAASLGGYTDWRIPNMAELFTIMNMELDAHSPDSTAFPGFVGNIYTSTTDVSRGVDYRVWGRSTTGNIIFDSVAKTTTGSVVLVRGG
jgi:hypothetical protein